MRWSFYWKIPMQKKEKKKTRKELDNGSSNFYHKISIYKQTNKQCLFVLSIWVVTRTRYKLIYI